MVHIELILAVATAAMVAVLLVARLADACVACVDARRGRYERACDRTVAAYDRAVAAYGRAAGGAQNRSIQSV